MSNHNINTDNNNSNEPGAPDKDGFITDPRDTDVLCGRGGAALRHPGNQTYRRLVNLNKGLYTTCLKTEKLKISRSIVAAIREQRGRFLEKNNDVNKWYDIGDKKAIEKTSQALREGQPKLRQKIAEMGAVAAVQQQQANHLAMAAGSPDDMMPPPQQRNMSSMQQQHQQIQQQQLLRQQEMLQQQRIISSNNNNSSNYDTQPLPYDMNGGVGDDDHYNNIQQHQHHQQQQHHRNNYHNRPRQRPQQYESSGSMHHGSGGGGGSTTASRQQDLHADMMRRLTLQDMQGIGGDNNNNMNQQQHHQSSRSGSSMHDSNQQQNRQNYRSSSLNARAQLARDLGIPESQLSLMSDLSAFGGSITSGRSMNTMNSGNNSSSNQQQNQQQQQQLMNTNNLAASINDSQGLMSVDSSFKRALMGLPLGSIHTLTSINSNEQLSVGNISLNSGGSGNNNNNNIRNNNNNMNLNPIAVATAAAAAVNNPNNNNTNNNFNINNLNNFDRRDVFAKMKYSRPPSVRSTKPPPQQQQNNMYGLNIGPTSNSHLSVDSMPDIHMLESNMSLYSNLSNYTNLEATSQQQQNQKPAAVSTTMDSLLNNMGNNNNSSSNINNNSNNNNDDNNNSNNFPSYHHQQQQQYNSNHHQPPPAAAAAAASVSTAPVNFNSNNVYQPNKVVVETAKVIDHSSQDRKNIFGDLLSGSRHSIMSGLSKISDSSIDQSIFSDLSKKIGNVSTRSMAMSDISTFDINEGDEDDDDFGNNQTTTVEGGPIPFDHSEQPPMEFEL